MKVPLKSIAIGVVSFIWLAVSISQWGVYFYDLDKLLFSIGFFLIGIYVAYDQWHKKLQEEKQEDLKKDLKQICGSLDRLENKFIDMKK